MVVAVVSFLTGILIVVVDIIVLMSKVTVSFISAKRFYPIPHGSVSAMVWIMRIP